jgi:hypothetical protein
MTAPATPSLSPELRLLLHLARLALGNDPSAIPDRAGVRWPQFAAAIDRHRLGPLLHRSAGGALAELCPPSVSARCEREANATLRRALAQTAEIGRLTDALAAAGVPTCTVKGVALARQLHGHIAARSASDIDLVVAPEDVARADATLQTLGLRRTRPDFALTPRQLRHYLRVKPEFEYVHRDAGLRIELLWRLEGLPDLPRLVPVTLGARAFHTLSLEDHALYLLQHGARHAWFRLFWLVDIARLLARDDLDWAQLHARARASRNERGFLQGIDLAVELLGAPRPAAVSANANARLCAEARRQLARTPQRDESLREWTRQLRYRLRLAEGWAAKRAVLAPHVFTPQNWSVWRLPDRWFWLYYPAAPALWLWRFLRRERAISSP